MKADLTELHGADAVAESLKSSGIEVVFGYAGGGTNALIDAIVRSGLRSISARTELSAAWMSYAYNRIRRRAASACVFHCVGALHATPVVYSARVDGAPFFMIDVGLDSTLDLREALQESLEVYPTLKQVSKFIRKLTVSNDLPLAVRQAVLAASTGRPGPSVLDIAFQTLVGSTSCRIEKLALPQPPAADPAALVTAVRMILAATRPLIIAGAGVHAAGAADALKSLAEATGIPVACTSWGGRGLLQDDDPLFAGVLGSFGWINANDLAQKSDLWLTFGVSFSQMTTAAWNLEKPADVIQFDIDPNQIGKIFQPTLGIVADAGVALRQLLEVLKTAPELSLNRDARMYLEEVRAAKREWLEYQSSLARATDVPINQYFLLKKMSEVLPPGITLVGDSGMHAFMMYRAFRYLAPTPVVQGSRYMSLGAGLPMAIGAKLASPNSTVVCFHGDGGLYYDLADLSLLPQLGIKLILVIDDNRYLAANRASATMMGLSNPWVELPKQVDFVTVARGFGIEAERVEEPAAIEGALRRALASEASYVIDVATDPDTRIKRAVKDVVPIISDRKPQSGGEGHVAAKVNKSWPN